MVDAKSEIYSRILVLLVEHFLCKDRTHYIIHPQFFQMCSIQQNQQSFISVNSVNNKINYPDYTLTKT